MANSTWALKEWAVVVDALLSGDLILLVRKGGIREQRPVFEVPSDRALLFPTYEHQQVAALRSPWQSQLRSQAVYEVGASVSLSGWAEVTHQLPLKGSDVIEQLHPFHIWTDAWLTERLAWKPERPAFGLLLRAYCLSQPVLLTYQKHHGGCRSWLELDDFAELPIKTPVLSELDYQQRVKDIQQAIAS
ncbi:MAG: DUF1802 family protein [Leptolyngbyaceae cyanobacterium]